MDEEKDKLSRTLVEKEIFPEDGQPKPKELLENVKNSSDRYLTGWRLTLVTISLVPGMFLKGVDSSFIGVATPGITTSFHTIDDLAWYGSGYMLPHSALQPILGAFYKSFNVRYVFLISIVIFEVGSCLCAAAPTSAAFIIGRVIAGCGAAGLLQGTLAIVGLSVPKRKIPLYYRYVLSVQGVSACTAPIFGGTSTDKLTWRCIVYPKPARNLPIGGVALAMVMLFVKPKLSKQAKDIRSLPPLQRLKRMDWAGTIIFLSAFYLQYIPIYFQAIRGTSALHGGVRMIAIDAGRIVFIIILSILVTKFGHYMPYMTDGTIITAIAAGLLTMFDIDTSTARSTAFMFLAGAGAGTGGNQPFTAL
ncbi:hypothetical protein QC760_005651 [Botrytis cinerea]